MVPPRAPTVAADPLRRGGLCRAGGGDARVRDGASAVAVDILKVFL